MPRTPQQYMIDQKAQGFHAGEKVRVLRSALSNEDGWPGNWRKDSMDQYVGEIGTVHTTPSSPGGIGNSSGIPVWFDKTKDYWYFPYFVLERLDKPQKAGIKVGDTVRILQTDQYSAPSMGAYVGQVGTVESQLGFKPPSWYIRFADGHKYYWLESSFEIFTETIPSIRKIDNTYPHTCPYCGAPSYNGTFIGTVDCSKKCRRE